MFTATQGRTVPTHPAMLLVLASILGIFSSSLLGASNQGRDATPPGLLPANTDAAAKPMDSATDEPLVSELWQALEDHDAGRLQSAIVTWQRVAMPRENQVWRHLGLGVAYLYNGQLNDAADELALAKRHDPENAAVHYFAGLLCIEQAESASEFADALHFTGTRLVSHTPGLDRDQTYSGKPKSRYELDAINELQLAIRYATYIDPAAPLVPVRWVVAVPYPMAEPAVPPTVEDLLGVLGADNLVGKSHGLLADLYLRHECPEEAEHHVDEAGSNGISVPYGYRLVGELYEEQGRSTDAFRAYMKAMKGGDGLAQPGAKALRSLRNAFEDLF